MKIILRSKTNTSVQNKTPLLCISRLYFWNVYWKRLMFFKVIDILFERRELTDNCPFSPVCLVLYDAWHRCIAQTKHPSIHVKSILATYTIPSNSACSPLLGFSLRTTRASQRSLRFCGRTIRVNGITFNFSFKPQIYYCIV